jgi:outer membrane protein OmpA-like peptidoglycan-associated protein
MTKLMPACKPTIGHHRRLRVGVVSMLVLLTACVHSEKGGPPGADRPAEAAGLRPADGSRGYDAGIAAVDETRTARQIGAIVPKRADRKIEVDSSAQAAREKQAIEAWAKEETTGNTVGSPPLNVAPPPRTVTKLALPPGRTGDGAAPDLPLPKPVTAARATPIEPRRTTEPPPEWTAAPRADVPKDVPPPPAKPAPELLPAAVPATPEPPVTPPPLIASAAPPAQVAAAEAVDPIPPPPGVPPAARVPFARQSAEISVFGRSELDRLARDANAARLRQMELRAYASDDDPVEARKMALTRALAVQSYLVDQGVKARIDVGFWAARDIPDPDRVDVLAPKL